MKVQLHHGDVDVGRTWGTPILKLGVSCRAAISKENVIWTEVCMEAADGGLAVVAVSIAPFGLAPSIIYRGNLSNNFPPNCASAKIRNFFRTRMTDMRISLSYPLFLFFLTVGFRAIYSVN